MNAAVIIVGIGQWEKYTEPLIDSILKYERDLIVICVDNGHKYTGVQKTEWLGKGYVLWNKCSLDENSENILPCSYAKAINKGLEVLWNFKERPAETGIPSNVEWVIITNNDVLCTGSFINYLKTLDKNTLYGNKIHSNFPKFKHPVPFIDGWIYAIPVEAVEKIGFFDENFKIAGFEDADYCFRGAWKGYDIQQSKLPFVHLEERIRKTFDNYRKHRLDNMTYLVRKHNLEWKK